jgi:dTDP-4-dehydrorhamnose reductase
MDTKTILVIGATGMLGNAQFTELSKYDHFDVFGTVRKEEEVKKYLPAFSKKIFTNVDIEKLDTVSEVMDKIKPDVVLNCVGLIKQAPTASNTALEIYMNALFPHKLAMICQKYNARMIHFSTDCVFNGEKGNYKETDPSDAYDVYGKTKYLGEVSYDNCFTIRTSIIGHGLEAHASLIDWFLSQEGTIKGFTKVIYSGFPTVEIARILAEYVIPNDSLKGLYQVTAEPISKYNLLKLVKKIYNKDIEILPFDEEVSDRSMDSSRFRKETGYTPPTWDQLIHKMYEYYKSNPNFIKY